MDGKTTLNVSMWRPTPAGPIRTVQVNGIPKGTNDMVIHMFFSSEKYCEGGDIEKIDIQNEEVVLITFKEEQGKELRHTFGTNNLSLSSG